MASSSSSCNQQKSANTSEPVVENRSPKHFPHARQKRSIFSFASSPVQSNLFAHSSQEKLQARPYDEFLMIPTGSDEQKNIQIKTDGRPAPRTDK